MKATEALRHQLNAEPQRFDILAHNKDGTVDLGLDGNLVIGHCKVSDTPAPGTCTLIEDDEEAVLIKEAKAKVAVATKALKASPDSQELKTALEAAKAELAALKE